MAIICPESPPCAGISSGDETKVPRPSAEQRFDPAASVLRHSGTVEMWFYFFIILTPILNMGTATCHQMLEMLLNLGSKHNF